MPSVFCFCCFTELYGNPRPHLGLVIWWDMLRCGYFWGGDGETHLKINWESLQADSETRDHRRPFLDPVSGRWCCDRCSVK